MKNTKKLIRILYLEYTKSIISLKIIDLNLLAKTLKTMLYSDII